MCPVESKLVWASECEPLPECANLWLWVCEPVCGRVSLCLCKPVSECVTLWLWVCKFCLWACKPVSVGV